jgi:DNA-binding IclR family transcriptional regulator
MATNTLQTLDRGLAALLLIGRTPHGLKVAELASQLELNRTVTYRIVGTLKDHGMLHRLEDGRFVLGATAYMLGGRVSDSVELLARPVLEELAELTSATAFLSMAQGDECVVMMTAQPRNTAINIHYSVGARHPLSRGAAGIAILAARPAKPDDCDDVIYARAQGYSFTRGQLHKGAVGLSSKIALPTDGFAGFEFSLGVVALEELDADKAAVAVIAASENLAASLLDHL